MWCQGNRWLKVVAYNSYPETNLLGYGSRILKKDSYPPKVLLRADPDSRHACWVGRRERQKLVDGGGAPGIRGICLKTNASSGMCRVLDELHSLKRLTS